MTDTLAKLTTVFHKVFDDDALVIDRNTAATHVPGWDSVMHITLMMGVERAFDIRFRSGEVAGLKDVGALIDLIESRRAG